MLFKCHLMFTNIKQLISLSHLLDYIINSENSFLTWNLMKMTRRHVFKLMNKLEPHHISAVALIAQEPGQYKFSNTQTLSV